jgi:hypothetical protein
MIKTRDEIKKEFILNTIKEYDRTRRIKNFCKPIFVDKTDGTFVQIGLRPQIGIEIFDPDESIFRGIFGLSRQISIGEEKYFIKNLLDKGNYDEIFYKDITIKLFNDLLNKIGLNENGVILIPSSFLLENLLKITDNKLSYDVNLNSYCLDNMSGFKVRVIFVNDDIIDNNIILYNMDDIIWKYKLFSEKQILDVEIKEPAFLFEKYDILVRVIIKQEFDPNKIRIIKIIA